MMDDISPDRFLTRRRIIDIRQILPDIESYLAEVTDSERKAWLQRVKKELLDELAELEARAVTLEATP
jgi:hypothetical protein